MAPCGLVRFSTLLIVIGTVLSFGVTGLIAHAVPAESSPLSVSPSPTAERTAVTPAATGPAVIDTLVLANNTLVPGNYVPSVYETNPGHYSPWDIALDSGKGLLFVDEENNTTVISDTSNKIVASPSIGNGTPAGLAYDSVQGEVWQANWQTIIPLTLDLGNLTVFSDTTYESVSLAAPGYWGEWPSGIAYDSGTHQMFVSDSATGNVTVLSAATGAWVTNITTSASGDGSDFPIVYDPTNSELYLSNPLGDNVTVISDKNDTAWKTIPTGADDAFLAYDSGKGEIFTSNYGSSNFSVINTTTNKVVATIPASESPSLMSPGAIAYDHATNELFVLDNVADGDDLNVIYDSNNTLTDVTNGGVTVEVGSTPTDLVVDPTNGYLYVTDTYSGTISIVNLNATTAPGALTIQSFTVLPASVTVGSTATFTTDTTGGTTPYTYRYTGLPPGCTSSDTATLVCIPSTGGTYVVKVFVNDSAPASVSATTSLTVTGGTEPTYLLEFGEVGLPSGTNWSVTLSGTSPSIILLDPLTTVSLTRWSGGTTSVQFYASNGSYTYTTSASGYSSGSGAVAVAGSSPTPVALTFASTPSSSSGLSDLDYLLLLVVVVVVVIVVVVLVARRGRKPRLGVQPYYPTGPVGGPPPGSSPPGASPPASPPMAVPGVAAAPIAATAPLPIPPPMVAPAVPACANCHRPTTLIPQYGRYYCYACARYA